MSDSIVKGNRCYYCGMEVWQETTSWLGEDDLSYVCSEAAEEGRHGHFVQRAHFRPSLYEPAHRGWLEAAWEANRSRRDEEGLPASHRAVASLSLLKEEGCCLSGACGVHPRKVLKHNWWEEEG